ncbi:MAG: PEP-CTERM sorting domain-containing protein [Pirellulales bacterium]|nr:PEP-CTERM sorting domain-containing protein [Pirellulales bacterium]
MNRFIGFFVAALILAGVVRGNAGDVLWGVTNGINDTGFWTGGEIFTVDTGTGNVAIKAAYAYSGAAGDVRGFGDIAMNGNGDMYVTYYSDGAGNFKTLAKVNTSDWSFEWTQTMPEQINALTFVGDTLYAAAGGGAVDNLYKFNSLDGTTAPTLIGASGYLGSDGDLFYDAPNDKLYNVYTPNSTGNLVELNRTTGVGTLIGTLNGTAKFGTTTGSVNYGWAGMEFDSAGKLWAANWNDQILYSRPNLLPGSDVVQEFDLSTSLGGNITGLSIPEPGTIAMLIFAGLTALAAAWFRAKKK